MSRSHKGTNAVYKYPIILDNTDSHRGMVMSRSHKGTNDVYNIPDSFYTKIYNDRADKGDALSFALQYHKGVSYKEEMYKRLYNFKDNPCKEIIFNESRMCSLPGSQEESLLKEIRQFLGL